MISEALKSKLIFVFGATGSLGSEFVKQLVGDEVKVVACGRDRSKLKELKEYITFEDQKFLSLFSLKKSVSDKKIIKDFETLVFKHGIPDVVINTVGVSIRKSLNQQSNFDIKMQIDSNLLFAILLTKYFSIQMLDDKNHEILHLSGFLDGRLALPYYSVDVATRAALVSFVESINRELNSNLIKVTVFFPPATDSKSESKYQHIWKKMGIPIESATSSVKRAISLIGSKHMLRKSGGLLTTFFGQLNAVSPMLANKIFINRYGKILKEYFGQDNPTENSV
jgi:short-subunit dehydrogenase